MNVENDGNQMDALFGTDRAEGEILTFKNVRNRRTLFLHASFVPHGSYLGRGGEWFPAPSKIYPDPQEQFFYVELSFDGYKRVALPYENFLLELSFIIDYSSFL
jgi:hypothetical protein